VCVYVCARDIIFVRVLVCVCVCKRADVCVLIGGRERVRHGNC